jgi:class 3 adenylate cyclase
MSRLRFQLSLRQRLMVGFSGLVVVMVLMLQIAISVQVNRRIRSDIEQDFIGKAELFGRIQEIRSRQLRQTATLLAEVPSLRASVSTGDAATVTQKLREELRVLLDFDPTLPDSLIREAWVADNDSAGLLLVTDPEGRVLGNLSSKPLSKFSIAEKAGLGAALEGEYRLLPSIWKVYDRYFTVMSVPIWASDRVIGALSYGFPFRKEEADRLSADIGSEVSLIIDDVLVASSFSSLQADDSLRFVKAVFPAILDARRSRTAQSTEVELRGESWQVFVSPIPQSEESASLSSHYIIASSLTRRLEELRTLQRSIAAFGIGAIVLALLFARAFAARISQPVDQLVKGIQRMQQGDYSASIQVTSRDEIGVLTEAYNQMLATLKERLEMLKFVSDATIEAIRKNLTDRELGGLRKEVTVFFSDIRGFTKWSEKRPPEEVIAMLNQTLSIQAEIVKKHGGDIDKFVGDELVAVFEGEQKDRNAVEAASEIQRKASTIFQSKGLDIAIGIGINTGAVVMGAMGSATRLDYTVIGNHVNLGARLCSAAGAHEVLIAESTARNLDRRTVLEEREPVSVKGIEKPVQIYAVKWESTV